MYIYIVELYIVPHTHQFYSNIYVKGKLKDPLPFTSICLQGIYLLAKDAAPPATKADTKRREHQKLFNTKNLTRVSFF